MFDESDDSFKVRTNSNLQTITSQNYVDQEITKHAYLHPDTYPASIITGLSKVATSGNYSDLTRVPAIPDILPANGNNAATVNGLTVETAVSKNAKFTDTNTWRGIQNNLTSDSTTDSLSAIQGKALKRLIDGKAASSHAHNYAGSFSAGGAATKAISDSDGKQINTTYTKLKIDIPESIDPVVVHRHYRGKNLGPVLTDAHSVEIKAEIFNDIFIRDYWEIDNIKWRIMNIDYYYNRGDTACITHHVVIVPDTNLYNRRMTATNVVTGGYIGSEMHKKGLNNAKTIISDIFESHLLTIRQLFANTTNGNVATNCKWTNTTV